jgi:hypothetical protein
MEETELKNQIVATQNKIVKTAINLERFADTIVKKHLHPTEPRIVKKEDVANLLGIKGLKSVSLSDKLYYLTDWESWKRIIANDWLTYLPHLKYKFDTTDCDNYAFLFASKMAWRYGLNSAGVVYGYIHRDNKKFGHAFNLILTNDLELKVFEPMKGIFADYNKEGTQMDKDRLYTINWVILF